MPTLKHAVKVYLDDEEYNTLKRKADLAEESMSSYLKKLGLGHRMTSKSDAHAIQVLHKANADLGRLGGLFKLAITEGRGKMQAAEFRMLLKQIERSQSIVAECSRRVTESFK